MNAFQKCTYEQHDCCCKLIAGCHFDPRFISYQKCRTSSFQCNPSLMYWQQCHPITQQWRFQAWGRQAHFLTWKHGILHFLKKVASNRAMIPWLQNSTCYYHVFTGWNYETKESVSAIIPKILQQVCIRQEKVSKPVSKLMGLPLNAKLSISHKILKIYTHVLRDTWYRILIVWSDGLLQSLHDCS